jgi:CheY-like chemotaxis protein
MNFNPRQLFTLFIVCSCADAAQAAGTGGGLPVGTSQAFQSTAVVLLGVLAGILVLWALGRVAINLVSREVNLDRLMPSTESGGRREPSIADDEYSKLMVEFRAGPGAASAPRVSPRGVTPSDSRVSPLSDKDTDEPVAKEDNATAAFFDWAQGQLSLMKSPLDKCGMVDNPSAQRNFLVEVSDRIAGLKERAAMPELRPAWQLATALDGLLRQLTGRVSEITPSTQRTIAGGLELMRDLCKPGVRADLASEPAIRILAVDDEPVGRFAICASLKKGFDTPDLAETGEAALEQIRKQRYDLILLDVMMPGMDGFELCARIRETANNGATPVLFVTGLKDFEARAKNLSMAGTDLLGKPFLAFEVAVKAFTLILRARLSGSNSTAKTAAASGNDKPAVLWPTLPAASEVPASPASKEASAALARPGGVPPLPPPVFTVVPGEAKASREVSTEFRSFVATMVANVKEQITAIGRCEDEAVRAGIISPTHLHVMFLASKLDLPELRPAAELCSALAGLFKKFKENSRSATPSALSTAVSGLNLLNDLCGPQVRTDLVTNPPIRVLVVDDEPMARRAITGALQMAFSRPEIAESGETALAVANDKQFDLVFMDVSMPGMDGFATCAKLHEIPANRATPVVFVTSHSDEAFRSQAARCGGSDYVVKPFVFMEITVKALTFALRGRLPKPARA